MDPYSLKALSRTARQALTSIKRALKSARVSYCDWRSFLAEYDSYRALDASSQIVLKPILGEKTPKTAFDYHYVYQGPWVFEKLHRQNPSHHVDLASYIGYLGFFSAIVPTTFIDIRPTGAAFPNFVERVGSALELPFDDGELPSLSCLHVIEHIGLGRYGDPLDPEGLKRAVAEMKRVVAPGGDFYLTTTVGKRMTYFNAHRVSDPQDILDLMDGYVLRELSGVVDGGTWIRDIEVDALRDNAYACGMYWFQRSAG